MSVRERTTRTPVERGLDLLEYLAAEGRPVALGDVSRALGLAKSATFRLLAQLVESGWVEQSADTGQYGLTLKLALVGHRYLHRTGLPDIYQPFLEKLAHRTEAFVRISILADQELTWVGQAQGGRAGLIYQPELLATVPLALTASGKSWLASLDEAEALRLVLSQGIPPPEKRGPKARVDLDDIREEIRITRERGWGLAMEEAEPGVVAIAVAIVRADGSGEVVGTLSVAGPTARITPDRYDQIAAATAEIARELSQMWP